MGSLTQPVGQFSVPGGMRMSGRPAAVYLALLITTLARDVTPKNVIRTKNHLDHGTTKIVEDRKGRVTLPQVVTPPLYPVYPTVTQSLYPGSGAVGTNSPNLKYCCGPSGYCKPCKDQTKDQRGLVVLPLWIRQLYGKK